MSEENKTVFDLGDRTMAFGVEGVVTAIDCEAPFEVRVRYKTGHYEMFTKDGKANLWHLEPSLKLIEKAKRKVKKKFWFYITESEIKRRDLSAKLYTEPLKSDSTCQAVEIELEVEE